MMLTKYKTQAMNPSQAPRKVNKNSKNITHQDHLIDHQNFKRKEREKWRNRERENLGN